MGIKEIIKKYLGIKRLEEENRLLREQIKTWSMVGVDLGIRDESFIIVATRLNGGMVSVTRTRFKNFSEAIDLCKSLESRFGIKELIKDFPKMRDINFF